MRNRIVALSAAAVVLFVGAAAGGAQQGAAKRSLMADDYVAIQQLYARYNVAIDTGDAEGWASTFTPDGVFNNSTRGHDALVQFVRDWRDKRNGANRRHWNSNLVITPTADGASGSVYLILLDIGVKPPVAATTGMYEDMLVKTAQGWRFKTRIVHGDPAPRPLQ
jgi:hypothetical protein